MRLETCTRENVMSIFDSIKNAIFGHARTSATPAKPAVAPAQASTPKPAPSTASPAPTTAPAVAATAQVDIEPVLDGLNAKSAQKLNWRTSIVDLMKLVGIDSSLEHRKALAKELGYTGDMNDSASMNIWLHEQVMIKLAQTGGKVPASLAH
jgi:hypothetical protein